MNPLFPALPADLASLTDEALQEALASRLATIDLIEQQDADTLGDRSAEAVLAEMQEGVEQIEAIRAQIEANAEGAAAYEQGLADLAAKARGPEAEATADAETLEAEGETPEDEKSDDDEDEKKEDEEPEAEASAEVETAEAETVKETVEEPVAASATPPRPVLRRPPRPTRNRQPVEIDPARGAPLLASAGIRGIRPGEPLDRQTLAEALIEMHRTASVRSGVERFIVASAHAQYPEDRILGDNPEENAEKIRAVTSPEAITAAGGICAPLTPLYDLDVVSVADRPVRAALAGFQATRGGISTPTPLSLADVADGVGVVTADDDALGGTFATKDCVVVDCDPYTDAMIEAIYACIQHGNFGARTWPERVSALGDLLSAQHAKVAEIELLDGIGAGSTAVTEAAVYGATSSLLQAALVASAAMRSRHRMRPDARLRAIFPAWAGDLMAADIVHTNFDGRFERTREGAAALLSQVAQLNVSYYLDSETGAGQIFGAQSAGALLEFPDTVVWYLFPEGSWLFLDGGELDLGIVRDSVLNATNDFQIFQETFEGLAFVGHESLKITSTVCPSGATAPAGSLITC